MARIVGSGTLLGFPRIMPSVRISGFDDMRPKKIDTTSFVVGSDSQSLSVRASDLCLQSYGSGKAIGFVDCGAAAERRSSASAWRIRAAAVAVTFARTTAG